MHRILGAEEIERRRAYLSAAAASDVIIDVWPLDDGPPAVESNADAAQVVPELLRAVPKWIAESYEAVIIGCFSDPGIAAVRDLTEIPVIGPGRSAMHLAAQFGERFSVLSSDPTPKGLIARLRSLGLAELFVSERMVGCSVFDLVRRPDEAFNGILAAARGCVDDGADILVMGCMGMGFMPQLTERLQDRIGVPVVNSVLAGLKIAEAAVGLRLRPAKISGGNR
ncbi:hydantoin racemase [Bradyrhizobium sp. CNPSo 4010]|uniref:Hydantoin racemase n=2 Tax=Bradyrhizobium agreste TaxID=2751811 RepID=A0ABS0PSX8_9BRAD|nr:hydantoin racemase [Bradyrhizobium agreste]